MSEYILVALIGFTGVVLGGLINAMTGYIQFRLKHSQQAKLDEARKNLLRTMLSDSKYPWRNVDTLRHVIGADEATTIRLLIELEARGSEDGQPLWGLIRRHPFPDRQ